ncbi:hypothetical protein Q1695_003880 [Nippostrongylus brasiliensis]|nr:hypothetical protein Q1695_003880 [Nippostrongylus brasiliensis]
MLFSIAFVTFSSLFVLYVWRYYEKVRRYPRGPLPYPVVGNLLSYDWSKIHEEITKISKVYGTVFTVWLPRPSVVITDYRAIKEAFSTKGDDFSGRSGLFPNTIFQNIENGGVLEAQGENWTEQLAGVASIEGKDEIHLYQPLQLFVGNIINQTLFGFRYDNDKCERLMTIVREMSELFSAMTSSPLTLLGQAFPIIYRLPIVGYIAKDRLCNMMCGTWRLIKEDVERALKSYSPDQEPECMVQAYYQKMQSNSNLDHDNLLSICMDFFLAGMETTTTTLRWSTLILAKHPEVQEKIRKEILFVIGANGIPRTSYKPRMPYTCAAIMELQRFANIIPANAVHRTVRDTSVGEYRIPADTLVLGAIHQVLAHSPVYKDGHEFRPERFLMEDGITANKEAVEQFCPFSIGKRQCAGEALARVELFVGLVTLLQHYEIEPVKAHPIDLESISGIVLSPKEQPLRLVPLTNREHLLFNFTRVLWISLKVNLLIIQLFVCLGQQ